MPLLQNYLGALCSGPEIRGPKFGARSSGPEVRGPKFGSRLLWYRYTKKYLIILLEIIYMNFFSTKLPGGHPIRGPGSDSCGIGMPKIIWLHYYYLYIYVFTCLWYKITWGHAVRGPKFGARSSGPEFCGTGIPKNMKYY